MHPSPDVLALVALGERTDTEAMTHVAGCVECHAELESLRRVVELGRASRIEDTLFQPSAAVWQRVHDGIDAVIESRVVQLHGPNGPGRQPVTFAETEALAAEHEAPEAVDASHLPTRQSRGRGRRRWSAYALVAAVALVVGLGGGYGVSRALDPANDVVGVTTLNALPRWRGANGTATVEKDGQGHRTLVVTVELPPNADVQGQMEVWMSDSRADDMVAMGIMPGTSGRFALPPSMDLKTHSIIDVSLEPRNDTNPAHSGNSVVRGRLAL